MDDIVSINTSRQRLNMLLMTIFGGSALVLAAIGIYGLMAYSVQHRTQEIGIRMALGAQPDRVRWSIVGQGMTLVGVGIVIGVGAALYFATFLAAALYGVKRATSWCSSACPPCSPRRRFAAVWNRGAAREPHRSAQRAALTNKSRGRALVEPRFGLQASRAWVANASPCAHLTGDLHDKDVRFRASSYRPYCEPLH
jgi:ABC-type antimicrobial peptide transport system permease subunit